MFYVKLLFHLIPMLFTLPLSLCRTVIWCEIAFEMTEIKIIFKKIYINGKKKLINEMFQDFRPLFYVFLIFFFCFCWIVSKHTLKYTIYVYNKYLPILRNGKKLFCIIISFFFLTFFFFFLVFERRSKTV